VATKGQQGAVTVPVISIESPVLASKVRLPGEGEGSTRPKMEGVVPPPSMGLLSQAKRKLMERYV